MSSLIQGYNYDIFISYRQKDNNYDGWVTEFVVNLNKELEATFKEDVSVYFDINPHDGLLETHDVDESLKEKLRCLIFIPIISRTYCDPKAFAWEHEFKAFVEQASKDEFGLKVKLPNGNVASRVLPIQIHDLKSADKALVEEALEGFLRSIEFIYKEPGVNRPLTARDSEEKSLNKTNYRNQINKVANTIDEIISVLHAEPDSKVKEQEKHKGSVREIEEDETKNNLKQTANGIKVKFLIPITVVALLIVAGIFVYPKIFKRDALERLKTSGERISVAVMPFQNRTRDAIWEDSPGIIQDIIKNSLSNSEEFEVRATESIDILMQSQGLANDASLTPSLARKISKRLDVGIFIYGSINQAGDDILLQAELADSKTGAIFKSFHIEGKAKEDNSISLGKSLSNEISNFLLISELKKDKNTAFENSTSSNSPEAYKYYSLGKEAFFKGDMEGARNLLLQAVSIDSGFTYAAFLIAFSYGNQGNISEAKKWALGLYKKRDQMSLLEKTDVNRLYANFFETPYDVLEYVQQLLEFDDQNPRFWYNLGNTYRPIYQFDNAILAYEKSLEIYDKWNSKPLWILSYTQLGECYHATSQYKKEKKLYRKAEKDFPNDPGLLYRQAILALSDGKTKAANEYIEKYITIREDNSASEAAISADLANIYAEAGNLDKAEEYGRQALSLEPENPDRINALAYFLIDQDRNVVEGLEFVERALESQPENYNFLHTKGWGLYKLGKYQEAVQILQKSWDIRIEEARYDHTTYLHLEEAKKAVIN